ncbi:hypothetical protein [Natrinema sp. SYSU A 869]|uniref:helix-turn-helix transcriptional regulator n=1 Tax=Natrinema sp. SYSU A 869 TaxID=2871694 RepID=UPI001CA41BE4|nr:hypothetical protein [Natrinema sp. SYSU A 869]
MRMSTAATLALTVLLATTTLGAVAATPSAQSPTTVERSPPAPSPSTAVLEPSQAVSSAATPPPPEQPATKQVIRIRITETGDAEWTIESRFRVTNETEVETFNEYAEAVVSEQRDDTPYGPQLFPRYAGLVAESTGREMSVENEGWGEYRIEDRESGADQTSDRETDRIGIISYTFTWTNFATVDGDQIHVGDSFQTDDWELFPALSSGQRLVIEPPPNYGFVDAPTGTDNGALVWDGPHEFSENGLQITILKGAGGNSPLFAGEGWLIAAILGLVIIVGGAAYLLTRRDFDVPVSSNRLSSLEIAAILDRNGDDDDDRETVTTGRDRGSEAVTSTPVDSAADGDSRAGTRLEFDELVEDEIDPELLSDEERVLRLLEQNGGRMKQASIVSETGWSNAKVSQLLSKMDDDNEIEKLRIGRENLITLPGVDPTETN